VTVRYEPDRPPALNQLNLSIRPTETVAFVGSSGAGKSTLVSALLRFCNPDSGQITLDGIPTNQLTLDNLRSHFAVVSQDITLFEGSIADNVAYASGGIDRDKVQASLQAANLWQYTSGLPEGMDTDIGTNGSKLSGGQRQRLAIARALYRNAKIWIFDEATSALDSESEAIVQQSIDALRGDKTLIVIAHRLSTIRNADRIFVLADGQVTEQGDHHSLMAAGGAYAGMVRIQSAD
jgi:subfamily B ATP-binding cassette protein MsbA